MLIFNDVTKDEIKYEVEETKGLENYTASVEEEPDNTFTITNTYQNPDPTIPSISAVTKNAVLDTEAEIAKPGDVINYTISVMNGNVAFDNLSIVDDVNDILTVYDISDNGKLDEGTNLIT